MVTLRQMEYLIAVADQRSFTRAAERLHVSQSGLSQQIQALERLVGASLLERLPNDLRLTAAGEAFARESEIALRAARRAHESVSEVVHGNIGRLEVATVLSLAVGLLPASMADWKRRWPGLTVTLAEFSHRRLMENWVMRGMADVAIGPRPEPWSGDLVEIGTERFVIVTAQDDPLRLYVRAQETPPIGAPRSEGRLSLERLRDRDWVMLARNNGLSELVEAHLLSAQLRDPSVVLRTTQTEAAVRLAASGLGVAIVPANILPPDLDALICDADPPLTRRLAAYSRARMSPAAQRFVDSLRASSKILEPPDAE